MGKSKITGGGTFAINGPVRRYPVFGSRKSESGDFAGFSAETTPPAVIGDRYDNQTGLNRSVAHDQRADGSIVFATQLYNFGNDNRYTLQIREWSFSGGAAKQIYAKDITTYTTDKVRYDIRLLPNGYTAIAVWESRDFLGSSNYVSLYIFNRDVLVTSFKILDYGSDNRAQVVSLIDLDDTHILMIHGSGYSVCVFENNSLRILQQEKDIGLYNAYDHVLRRIDNARVLCAGSNTRVLSISNDYTVSANTAVSCSASDRPSVQKLDENMWVMVSNRMIARMSVNRDNTVNMEYVSQQLSNASTGAVWESGTDLLHVSTPFEYIIYSAVATQNTVFLQDAYPVSHGTCGTLFRTPDGLIRHLFIQSEPGGDPYFAWHAITRSGVQKATGNVMGVMLQSRLPGELGKVACIK